jgi:NADH:ubiquinone oxidoreductase subunit E
MVEEVECIAACDRAPAIQINYEYYGPVDTTAAVEIIEKYRSGALQARTISGSSRGAK